MGLPSAQGSTTRDPADNIGVADLIRKVATLERVEIDGVPERFFEVEMRGSHSPEETISLISPLAISDYLSQVAPVPFSPMFELRCVS